ncbi:MAG: 5-bromo-4-chloroindolyl phosphate hydrolysis family protein [Alphaproteobacteria bacterium]
MSSRRVGTNAGAQKNSSSRRVSSDNGFSDDNGSASAAKRKSDGRRPNGRMLTILPFLFVPGIVRTFWQGQFVEALAILVGMVLLLGGAKLVRRGIENEADEGAKLTALPSRFPNKSIGALAYGLGMAVASAFVARYGFGMGLLYGVVTGAAVIVRYGVDEKLEKSEALLKAEMSGIDVGDLLRKMAEAKERVAKIRANAAKLTNPTFSAQTHRIADSAEAVIEQIERDPRDIRSARKFLISYLKRAEDVTKRFTSNEEAYTDKPEIERKFAEALNDLEIVFQAQNEKLLANDSLDLEVKLDVLSQRLKSEGAG